MDQKNQKSCIGCFFSHVSPEQGNICLNWRQPEIERKMQKRVGNDGKKSTRNALGKERYRKLVTGEQRELIGDIVSICYQFFEAFALTNIFRNFLHLLPCQPLFTLTKYHPLIIIRILFKQYNFYPLATT
jgi:hypothetical protein